MQKIHNVKMVKAESGGMKGLFLMDFELNASLLMKNGYADYADKGG